jgi:hypothetical protein
VEVLLRVVAAALCIRGATTLSLDLSRVAYIDAAGVAGLLECQRQTHQLGRTFVLAPVSPQVLAGIGACVAGRLLYSASRITDVVPDGNSLRPPGRQRRRLFCSRPPRSRGGASQATPSMIDLGATGLIPRERRCLQLCRVRRSIRSPGWRPRGVSRATVGLPVLAFDVEDPKGRGVSGRLR